MAEEDKQVSNEVKEEPKVEAQENSTDDKFVEKDGEVYLQVEDEQNEPESEPEEGQTEQDKQDDTSTKEEVAEEDSMYAGKSREEVIEMHRNANQKISEQGNELGSLRKQVVESPKDETPEQILAKMNASQVRTAYSAEKAKLDSMDVDDDTYAQQKELVGALETDWLEKRQDEMINNKFNSIDNTGFIAKQKDNYKARGIELSDSEFDSLTSIAKEHYSENGKLTENSYMKALIDHAGVDKVQKYLTMDGERKARQDITNATKKVENKIDVRGSGKNAKLVNISKLSTMELNKLLDGMTPAAIDTLYKKIPK